MGWQDAPVVEDKPDSENAPKWANAPIVEKPDTKPERKTPLSWYEKAKAADESGNPEHAGLAQGGRIADAATQAWKEFKSGSPAAIPGVGPVETAMNVITGLGGSIIGGIGGMGDITAQGIKNQVNKGFHFPTRDEFDQAFSIGADTTRGVQQAMTYQPRTGVGKLGSEIVSIPLNAASEAGRSIGGDIGQALGNRNAGEEIGGALPAVVATVAGGEGALKSGKTIADLPKEAVPGKDFSVLRDLTPEQQKRYWSLRNQGIKPTLGQITRDPEQWRFEEQTGAQTKSEPGKPVSPGYKLYQRAMDTNDALIKAVDEADKTIKGKPTAETESQTGQSLRGTLEKKARMERAKITDLYNQARQAGETKQPVDVTPLEKFLKENDAESLSVNSLASIKAKLNKLKEMRPSEKGPVLVDESGVPLTPKAPPEITVDDMEELRKAANSLSNPADKPSTYFMKQVKTIIDQITDGKGGDLYKKAREARSEYSREFEDRAGIARLIEKKPGSQTDYRTPTEDIFKKTVINGSRAELNDVIQSLKDIDLKKDPSGAQALRNLQRQTVNYLLDKATEKGVPNAREAPAFSATQFRNAVKSIGEDKLTDILGPDAVANLQKTIENAKTVKQAPGKVGGSDTAQNFRDYMTQAALDSGKNYLISKIPGADMIKGYLKQKAADQITSARVEEALNPRKAAPETVKKMAEEQQQKRKKEVRNSLKEMAKKGAPAAASGSQSSNSLKDFSEE